MDSERLNDFIPDKVLLRHVLNDLKREKQRIAELEAMNEFLANEVKELSDKLEKKEDYQDSLSIQEKQRIAAEIYQQKVGMSAGKLRKECEIWKERYSNLMAKIARYGDKDIKREIER